MSYRRAANLDKNLVWSEYFNDEQSLRKNRGTPTDITFDKGVVALNGSSSIINYYDLVDSFPTDVISFRCKVKFASEASDMVIFHFSDKDLGGVNLSIRPGNNVIAFAVAGGVSHSVALSSYDFTEWHEITGSWDGATTKMYIDGTEVTDTGSGGWVLNGTSAKIGARGPFGSDQYDFEGEIDFIELYNKALTAEEASNLFNDARYRLPKLNKNPQYGHERCTVGMTGFPDDDDNGIPNGMSINGSATASITGGIPKLVHDGFAYFGLSNLPDIGQALITGTLYYCEFSIRKGGTGVTDCDVYNAASVYTFQPSTTFQTFRTTFRSAAATFMIRANGATGGYLEYEWISIREVTLEPIKEILNINAFSGVARNVLSGDYVNPMTITTGYIFNNGTGGDAVVTYSNGVVRIVQTTSPSENYRPTIKVDVEEAFITGAEYFISFKSKLNSGSLRFSNGTPIRVGGVVSTENAYRSHLFNGIEYFGSIWTAGDNQDEIAIYLDGSIASGFDLELSDFSIQRVVPEVTNTDIQVVKQGEIYAPRFNADSAKIDCGDYHDLTGDITFLGWFKLKSIGRSVLQARFFDNGQLIIRGTTPDDLAITSNASDYSITTASLILLNWIFLAITRRADGTATIYYNGEAVGTVSSDSGTPVAGSTNMIVGNQNAGNRGLDDIIGEEIILSGLLTAAEISQYYTATKHKYQK